jgi:hypothetical protein
MDNLYEIPEMFGSGKNLLFEKDSAKPLPPLHPWGGGGSQIDQIRHPFPRSEGVTAGWVPDSPLHPSLCPPPASTYSEVDGW